MKITSLLIAITLALMLSLTACNGVGTPTRKKYNEGETRTTPTIIRVNFVMEKDKTEENYDQVTTVTMQYGDKVYTMTQLEATKGYSFKLSLSIVSTSANGNIKFTATYKEIGGKDSYQKEYENALTGLIGYSYSPIFDIQMPISQVGV